MEITMHGKSRFSLSREHRRVLDIMDEVMKELRYSPAVVKAVKERAAAEGIDGGCVDAVIRRRKRSEAELGRAWGNALKLPKTGG